MANGLAPSWLQVQAQAQVQLMQQLAAQAQMGQPLQSSHMALVSSVLQQQGGVDPLQLGISGILPEHLAALQASVSQAAAATEQGQGEDDAAAGAVGAEGLQGADAGAEPQQQAPAGEEGAQQHGGQQ